MIESTVDLPQPECPSTATNSPCSIVALTSLTAMNGPEGGGKTLVRPVSSNGTFMGSPGNVPQLRSSQCGDDVRADVGGLLVVGALRDRARPRQLHRNRRTERGGRPGDDRHDGVR